MRKIVLGLIYSNLAISIFVFIDKWVLSTPICPTCNAGLKTTHLILSLLSLVGACVILGLYMMGKKWKVIRIVCIVTAGVSAVISSALMNIQATGGWSICWLCFTSEIFYYLVFIAVTTELVISPKFRSLKQASKP
ncbi:hypothetical protein [Thermosyntropha lipolytica]|uniref:hypothetical protein n=1 Tax=Thermosyntropha lipolytica TaxID=54294 RepID=UPI000932F427|nr:hypothetical protein [Thermosyntropha lipolytica]